MGLNRNLLACAAVLSLAASAVARVGVDENVSNVNPQSAMAPAAMSGDGGSGGASGFDVKEGGFYWRSNDGKNKLVVGGMLQGQFFGQTLEGDANDTATFRVRRARLSFNGNLYQENFKYFVQVAADHGQDLELLDGWVKYVYSDSFAFKVGQFKAPINRQFMTSEGKLQFVNQSLASAYFSGSDVFNTAVAEREVGVEASGGFSDNKLQWAGAFVNGNGRNRDNGDTKFQYIGRIAYNIAGDYGYSEGDTENSDKAAATVGFGTSYHDSEGKAAQTAINLDGGFKHKGASIQGEYYWVRNTDINANHVDVNAAYIQGGYFIAANKAELAGRWSNLAPEGKDNNINEYTFGFNYYWFGHRLKAQANYTRLDPQASSDGVNQFWAQLQAMF